MGDEKGVVTTHELKLIAFYSGFNEFGCKDRKSWTVYCQENPNELKLLSSTSAQTNGHVIRYKNIKSRTTSRIAKDPWKYRPQFEKQILVVIFLFRVFILP